MDDFFVKKEDILIVDLHEMTVLEAEYILEKELDTLPYNIKIVEVIHGFHKGQALQDMVRKKFKHPRIKRKYLTLNKGITRFEIANEDEQKK